MPSVDSEVADLRADESPSPQRGEADQRKVDHGAPRSTWAILSSSCWPSGPSVGADGAAGDTVLASGLASRLGSASCFPWLVTLLVSPDCAARRRSATVAATRPMWNAASWPTPQPLSGVSS